MIVRLAQRNLTTKFGTFLEILYYDGQTESIALVMGSVENGRDLLCRIHSACLSAQAFHSIECDCREQMELSQFFIAAQQQGVIIYLDQEGRGNGHLAVMSSSSLKDSGLTQTEAYQKLGFPADARSYQRAAEILQDLKVNSITLLTNNPDRIEPLTSIGIDVTGTKRLEIDADREPQLAQNFREKLVNYQSIKH